MSKALIKLQKQIQVNIIEPRTVEYLTTMIEGDRLVITSYDPYLRHIRWELEHWGKNEYRIHYPNGFSWVKPMKQFLIMLAAQLTSERVSTIYKK